MGITHERVIAAGDRGKSADWNADHIISDDLMPKSTVTKIVAAYDSIDKTRADFVCNGIQDDVEIQAAIDSLPTQGGNIYLKEGTYVLSGSVNITIANVCFIGAGSSSNISWNGDFPAIYSTASSLLVTDLKFSGPGSSNTSADGISFYGNDNSLIKCWFSNAYAGGSFPLGSSGNFISSNYFGNCYYGISLNNASRDLITSNIFYSCNKGVFASNHSSNNIYSNNIFNGCSSYSLHLNNEYDSVITSNLIFNGSNWAMVFDNGCYDLVISNNHISANYGGFTLWTSHDSTVTGNKVEDSTTDSGIKLYHAVQNVISSNSCQSNANYEIEVDADSDRIIILGNMCVGTHTGAISNSGTNTEVAHNITS